MAAKKSGRSAPIGKKLGPPYGQVATERIGAVTVVVRCIFARTDYFHWRIIKTDNPHLLELVERQRGGIAAHGDAASKREALADAKKWLAKHPKIQIGS